MLDDELVEQAMAYFTARHAAEAQYAEALFDMAIAYPHELMAIYDDLALGDADSAADDDDDLAKKVKAAASRSAIAQDLAIELAGLSGVPCESFRVLAEALTQECRAGWGDRKELQAVFALVEASQEYERALEAIDEALYPRNEPGPPLLTVLQGGRAHSAPPQRRCRLRPGRSNRMGHDDA